MTHSPTNWVGGAGGRGFAAQLDKGVWLKGVGPHVRDRWTAHTGGTQSQGCSLTMDATQQHLLGLKGEWLVTGRILLVG